MLESEQLVLWFEMQRAKQIMLAAALVKRLAVAKYFQNVWDAIASTLEMDVAAKRVAELHQQLFNHDGRFGDAEPSKYDAEQSAAERQIRHENAQLVRLQQRVERCYQVDQLAATAVDAFLDDLGRPKEDLFRPANFAISGCRWSAPDLERFKLDVEFARAKLRNCDLQSAASAELDLQSFLQLVNDEIVLSRKYVKNVDKLHTRAIEVYEELLPWGRENTKLKNVSVLYNLSFEEYSMRIAELRPEYACREMEVPALQDMLNERAELVVQLKQLRTKIAERAGPFLAALDAKGIPRTSLLRTAISSLIPAIAQDAFNQKMTLTERGLIIAIGEWWKRWHAGKRNIPHCKRDLAWDDLAQALTKRGFLLEDFLSGKDTISALVNEAQPSIRDWWELAGAMKKPPEKNKELRRILQKRLSEIHERQYLPLKRSTE